MKLEAELREKWKPVLQAAGRVPQEKVEEFKKDVESLNELKYETCC